MSKGSAERPVSRSVPDALRGPKSTRSSKYFGWKDLAPYAVDNCDSFVASRYEFVQYLHVDALPLFLKANPRCVALKLPLGVLASKLTVRELVTLARIHRVSLDRGESKGSMLSKFCSHLCTDCDSFRAVFLSCALTRQSLKETLKLEPVEKIARRVRPFAFSRLLQFCTPAPEHLAAFVDGARFASLELIADGCSVPYSTPDLLVVSPAPWYFLALHGSRPVHLYLAKLHGLSLPSRCSRSEAIKLLSDHSCVDCSSFYAVFRPINLSDAVDDFSMGPATICGNDKVHKYPPSPIAADETMDIIRDFCRNLEPSNFEEAGCAVCGQLTLLSLLSPLSSVDFSLDPLIEPGLARKERMTSSDPVQYADGPILADGCSSICDLCSVSLRKGRRPVVSLANGAWVGGVPSELSDLTYAEQCLIARVRCNRYVVRVSFGQSKLIANAISFPAPTLKVYSHLPPPRAELEEVLAVIFTGVKPPTEEDLERTPLLVRRNKVSSALEWLKLNHSDYADLCIDLDALNSYPDGGVPVKVVHKTMLEDSNVVVSATSIHETEDETGTSEGPCPFTVHELVGSNLTNMTTSGRKAAALRHLQSGGSVLAVGHSDVPESMYNNPGLYPQIYPWLFPYGLGGVGNPRLQGLVSESRHKKLLLTYYDKRFQYDSRFVLMAFNHEQLKAGTTSSFILTKRSNFSDVVRKVSQVNPAVLKHIANRLEAGERVTPSTDDEKLCFSILDQVEHVGGAVHGSLAGKKRMRAELWSLISYIGAPSWFVTISPVDSKHPLCLYWADKDLKFDLNLRDYNQRARLIAANPVAGARFFHFLVQLFIRHLLKWADNSDGKGIFGHTSAYYGTVEQQGRMTLHLHMLIWISGAWSPQTVRERLMSDDSEFTAELISYLEGCQVGEFFTGTMEDMKQRHSTDGDSSARDYDPTQHFPVPPPTTDCLDYTCCTCGNCVAVKDWYSKYQLTVDDIVYRSNVHRCFAKKDIVLDGVRKQHLTGKGCINKDGVCTARFPREVHEESTVDSDGRISLKKLEPMINTINPVVTYCFGCNTDVTCLSSGTAVNATTGYVADYIVKMGVKSHQIFSSIYDVFERNTDVWSESKSNEDAARKLILKMANSLTSKVEIGGPMAAMYLLGNPDHYTSHIFVPFYWKPYVSDVLRCWEVSQCSVLHQGVQAGADIVSHSYASPDKVEPHGSSECDEERTDDNDLEEDRVLIARQGKKFVSRSSIDDYKLRPAELDHVCLYDWVQCGVRKSLAEIKGKSTSFLLYAQGHPLRSTHVVVWDINRKHSTVPCVLGPYLPRRDAEDRDFYCCTMLTFFVPWRTGLDLRSPEETWSQRFDGLSLEARYQNIVNNMNVRYECYDARDDFHSQIKARLAAQVAADNDDADDPGEPECSVEVTDCPDSVDGLNENLGQWTRSMMGQMSDVEGMLHKAGWNTGTTDGSDSSSSSVAFCPERSLPPSRWKDIVDAERSKLLNARLDSVAGAGQLADDMENEMRCRNDARIIPGSYLLSSFTTMDGDVESHLERIRGTFGLNTEQKRAFNVVAHHSLSVSPEPLRMYIGGMGGTGKTQVIKALLKWFEERGEPHRMAVLAPTGAAASIIRGSTYHSFLGVRTGKKKGRGEPSVYSLEDARLRLTGVDYIFLDEISMVSCQEFYLIDARLKELCKKFDVAFGGLSMIVAGDFAQLPPAGGLSLYSGKVSAVLLARQDQEELENTLGKLLWHQFVTVVILRENMRQRDMSDEDVKLRGALERLRYKDCTVEDINFLKSLSPYYNRGVSYSDTVWKNVSVITAWNCHKDQINQMNSVRFAQENGRVLHHFYSIDKKSLSEGGRRKTLVSASSAKQVRLTPSVQNALWSSAPNTSEHIPGCLSICVDMPVMIRHNNATEICITKGQEAVVKGWTSREIPGHPGRHSLDTLFVELVKPSKKVKLPHLPVNVVPLMKISNTITAILPSDRTICLNRSQVPVLPNFAMTDYASQGKTRAVNVVDISHCRSHQAIYTCLSRGESARNTLILREFSEKKLKGKLSGFLREEYRDLDMLDEVSKLQYAGQLQPGILHSLRAPTIKAFKSYNMNHQHNANGDRRASDVALPSASDRPRVKRNIMAVSGPQSVQPRKRAKTATISYPVVNSSEQVCLGPTSNDGGSDTLVTNCQNGWTAIESNSGSSSLLHLPTSPITMGLADWMISWKWDSTDWSCAFDSYMTIIRAIWYMDPDRWTTVFERYGGQFQNTGHMLLAVENSPGYGIDDVRFSIRSELWKTDVASFPVGQHGTDLFSLVQAICGVDDKEAGLTSFRKCRVCLRRELGQIYEGVNRYMHVYNDLSSPISLAAYVSELDRRVGDCHFCGGALVAHSTYPPLINLQLPDKRAELIKGSLGFSPTIGIRGRTYRLAGIVYHGQHHFTSRVIRIDGSVYAYNDMLNSGIVGLERRGSDPSVCHLNLGSMGDNVAVLATYALDL